MFLIGSICSHSPTLKCAHDFHCHMIDYCQYRCYYCYEIYFSSIEASSKLMTGCWFCYKSWPITVHIHIHHSLNVFPLRCVFYFLIACICTCPLVKCIIVFFVPELSSENMRTCFQIVNAYLYLSATDFLQVTHTRLITMVYNFPLFMFTFKYIFFPPTELCRVFVSFLLWFAKRHHKRGAGPSSEGTGTQNWISGCQNNTLIVIITHIPGLLLSCLKICCLSTQRLLHLCLIVSRMWRAGLPWAVTWCLLPSFLESDVPL